MVTVLDTQDWETPDSIIVANFHAVGTALSDYEKQILNRPASYTAILSDRAFSAFRLRFYVHIRSVFGNDGSAQEYYLYLFNHFLSHDDLLVEADLKLGSVKFENGKIVVSYKFFVLIAAIYAAIGAYPDFRDGIDKILEDIGSAKTLIETYVIEDSGKVELKEYQETPTPLDEVYSGLIAAVREEHSLNELLSKCELPPFPID